MVINQLFVSTGKEISESRMMLLRWTASSGQSQVLRLQQEMSPKWRDIGQLLCISGAQLDGWKVMYHHDSIRCIDRVVQTWMQRNSEQVREVACSYSYVVFDIAAILHYLFYSMMLSV